MTIILSRFMSKSSTEISEIFHFMTSLCDPTKYKMTVHCDEELIAFLMAGYPFEWSPWYGEDAACQGIIFACGVQSCHLSWTDEYQFLCLVCTIL